MNKKTKILIAVGGTGGHVFPGYNLAEHLVNEKYNVDLVTDLRGYKYIRKNTKFETFILPSSRLIQKNILTMILSSVLVFYSILRSVIFLIRNRPLIIFGMGGYASFPICIAATILRIKFIIYENNLIIGKANKYLLSFANKILVSHNEVQGIPEKYEKKIIHIGNIIKKEIIEFSNKEKQIQSKEKLKVLILGGSQAAKVFGENLPLIFKECKKKGISLKIYQHCLPSQNEKIKSFYKNANIDYEIFNFSDDLINYFSKINLAITRSGSSILAELTNANIPFITIPLPSSADDHQLKNAIYYQNKNFSLLVEEKDLNNKLLNLIERIFYNNSILDKIKLNQRQYSDKNVYKNINKTLKEIIDEKN